MTTTTKIIAAGSYLPEKYINNDEFPEGLQTSDEWIYSRTGIKKRHIAAEGEYTLDLAYQAALSAINNSNIDIKDIDCVMVATTTPDLTFPSTATRLQSLLGITGVRSFDIQAVCAGFVYGLDIADALIKSGKANNILFVGAETMSRILDWNDRSTCVLFGDGAGAVILSNNARTAKSKGILCYDIGSDGSHYQLLYTDGGVSFNQKSGKILMRGRELFKHAVDRMSNSLAQVMSKAEMTIDDIDKIIPHQANVRIIDAIANKLKISDHKIVKTTYMHANTSAASIPLALHHAIEHKIVSYGDIIAVTAFGSGLTWGSLVISL